MPKYQVGQRFRFKGDNPTTTEVFVIEAIRTLQPDGKIGYELRHTTDPGYKPHLFEAELDRHFLVVDGAPEGAER